MRTCPHCANRSRRCGEPMGHLVGSDGPGAWCALDDLVVTVIETRAAIASLQAAEASLLSDAVDLVIARTEERRAQGRSIGNDLPLREVCAELGAAMRLSDRTVQARIGDASTLVTSFGATHAAWRDGRIDAGHTCRRSSMRARPSPMTRR